MRQALVIAANTWREAERYKLFWAVVGFALFLILAALPLRNLTLVDELRVFEDVGFLATAFCGNLLAVLVGADLFESEAERGTLDLQLAFGVPRSVIVIGRWLGIVAVVLYAFLLMGMAFLFLDAVLAGRLEIRFAAAVAALAAEGVVLASLALLFATFLPRFAAIILAFAFFLVGHFGEDVVALTSGGNVLLAVLGNVAYLVLPHLELFDLYGAWIMGAPRGAGETLLIGLYAAIYASGVAAVAVLSFRSRRS